MPKEMVVSHSFWRYHQAFVLLFYKDVEMFSFFRALFFTLPIALGSLSLLAIENPSETVDDEWRLLKPDNLVLLTMPHGNAIIALAPQFAPNHVARFKSLVRAGFYDGMPFNRVIDGFVAQAGPEEVSPKAPPLVLEGEWPIDSQWSYTFAQAPDMFAPQTGFKDGFAVGVDSVAEKAWLLHCPGVIGLGRNNEPDTASSHFYITIGQAPRYLDRIMSLFGRVVSGMEHIQGIQRTENQFGVVSPTKALTTITKMTVMSDLPAALRVPIAIANTQSESFKTVLRQRKYRTHPFFYKAPPPVLDVCQVPLKSSLQGNL